VVLCYLGQIAFFFRRSERIDNFLEQKFSGQRTRHLFQSVHHLQGGFAAPYFHVGGSGGCCSGSFSGNKSSESSLLSGSNPIVLLRCAFRSR